MVMKHNKTLKLLSALLAGVMVFTPLSSGVAPTFAAEESSSSEQESTTAPEKTEEEKREEARKKLEAQKAVLEVDLEAGGAASAGSLPQIPKTRKNT